MRAAEDRYANCCATRATSGAPRGKDGAVSEDRGYRVVPHTADVILEAWGPDLAACCEEAVAALASTYVDGTGAAEVERRSVHVDGESDEQLLLELLEEVIFALDTAEGVPVAATARAAVDGGLDVTLVLADPDTVEPTGSAPKAVSHSELVVERQPGRVTCRFLIDV